MSSALPKVSLRIPLAAIWFRLFSFCVLCILEEALALAGDAGRDSAFGEKSLDGVAGVVVESALTVDDECGMEAGKTCALSALQLRGMKEIGSCEKYGCVGYMPSHTCQCNRKCQSFGNCCLDYLSSCSTRSPNKVHGHPSRWARYPTHKGFTLALVEEFNKPLDLDTDPIWTWSDGALSESQVRYVKEAITFKDGKMRITVSNQSYPTDSCSHAESHEVESKNMTSGEMRTRYNQFRYGRYEASIKAPTPQSGNTSVNGNYVATMFVFRDGKYEHWREMQFEILGDTTDSVHTNVMYAEKTQEWTEDIEEPTVSNVGCNLRSEFHTYTMEWLPDRITWYFDGKVIREKKAADGGLPISDLSAKVMFSTWVYDHRALFGGHAIENNRYPIYTEYDWFRFYKWDGDEAYPCEGLQPDCLRTQDRYLSGNNPHDGIPQEGTMYGKAPCVAGSNSSD